MIDIINYDSENIFAKILRNEMPCEKVFENEKVLAFKDINPQAEIHIIVIPKENFCSFNDFSQKASNETIISLNRSVGEIANTLSLKDGYRIICNVGMHGGQEVPHLYFHILAGQSLGKLIL